MDKHNYIMLPHTILTFEKSWLWCPLISGSWGTFLCCLLKVLPFIYKFFSPHGTDFWWGRNQSSFILTPHGYPMNPALEFILPFWPTELFAINHISTWVVSMFSSMFHWLKRSWSKVLAWLGLSFKVRSDIWSSDLKPRPKQTPTLLLGNRNCLWLFLLPLNLRSYFWSFIKTNSRCVNLGGEEQL